jgi:putative flippase GtrA
VWRPSRTLWGYLAINSATFALDIVLLTLFHGAWGWPLPFAITASYLLAVATSYVLNRTLNFRSHAPIVRQVWIYGVIVVLNYLLWILGLADLLAALGVEYQMARIAAGLCEAIYMYLALRWVVFRDSEVTV